ncbi:MAG: phage shock protein PspC [Patescibacteria group bacterium]|nr:phage shock protein PspC [Patescibacteria group bacterium]
MNNVTIIHLNGKVFHIEEAGHILLRSYLDSAKHNLEGNPDREEILRDIENAIADKCEAKLHAHKTVILESELKTILDEMGAVSGSADSDSISSEKKHSGGPAPKKLYNIREGAMIAGVCQGLAAYFNIDVTIVRVVFVILAIVTHGAWILVYLVLLGVIPYAHTSEQKSAAFGVPFNAQELVDRAKSNYSEFKDKKAWKKYWHDHRHQWKKEWHETVHENKKKWSGAFAKSLGFLTPVLGILMALLTIIVVIAIVMVASTGLFFGLAIPFAIPIWIAIVILVVIYNILLAPIRAMMHLAGRNWNENGWFGTVDGVMWIGIIAVLIWAAYHYVPQVRPILDQVWNVATAQWHRIFG